MSLIQSVKEVLAGERARAEELSFEEEAPEIQYSALASHISSIFTDNDNSRRDSGVEDEILDSYRDYRGEYSAQDLARIAKEGGSRIFMNLPSTKCRNALSWIQDIYLPAKGFIFSIEPTPKPELPPEIRDNIASAIEQEFAEVSQPQQDPNAPPQQQPNLEQAQQSITDLNQKRRDISRKIESEINLEAKFQLRKQEQEIADQFAEGGFDKAFTEFLTDFVISPTAFLKGPVITSKKKLTWVNGQPEVTTELCSIDERVDPIDMYPSAGAKCIQEGDLCEHIRLDPIVLQGLKDLTEEGYDALKIHEILEEGPSSPGWLPSTEEEVADLKMQGESMDINANVFHGIHYHGSAKVEDLIEWGLTDGIEEGAVYAEVEAILVNSEVIKVGINSDPLLRRPYNSGSYINRPGSIWGLSLPGSMRADTRMCNATARALANNLAISSGPQVMLNIDRIMDDGDIEEMYPLKTWQFGNDPTGNSGAAIDFFQPNSNAAELLKVYEFYEQRADEVTGIPRYAYGNDNKAGATTSPNALAMILETASKTIRNCVRNIDTGVVIPRVEQQFYINTLKNGGDFTGDVQVVAKGSATLSIKGAQHLRRNEFLNVTANPTDQGIMGIEGRAEILRAMADDLGLPTDIIPDGLELKRRQKEQAEQAKAQQEAQIQERLAPTQVQVQGQQQMHEGTQKVKIAELQTKASIEERKLQLREAEIMQQNSKANQRSAADIERTNIQERGKDARAVREIALKLQTGSGI